MFNEQNTAARDTTQSHAQYMEAPSAGSGQRLRASGAVGFSRLPRTEAGF